MEQVVKKDIGSPSFRAPNVMMGQMFVGVDNRQAFHLLIDDPPETGHGTHLWAAASLRSGDLSELPPEEADQVVEHEGHDRFEDAKENPPRRLPQPIFLGPVVQVDGNANVQYYVRQQECTAPQGGEGLHGSTSSSLRYPKVPTRDLLQGSRRSLCSLVLDEMSMTRARMSFWCSAMTRSIFSSSLTRRASSWARRAKSVWTSSAMDILPLELVRPMVAHSFEIVK